MKGLKLIKNIISTRKILTVLDYCTFHQNFSQHYLKCPSIIRHSHAPEAFKSYFMPGLRHIFLSGIQTSSAQLRSAQRSSVLKFDSDLFSSEKLISLDWLREAQLLNSIITQTCFTQKIFESFYGHRYLIYQYSRFAVFILILKVQRTSMSFESSIGALEEADCS